MEMGKEADLIRRAISAVDAKKKPVLVKLPWVYRDLAPEGTVVGYAATQEEASEEALTYVKEREYSCRAVHVGESGLFWLVTLEPKDGKHVPTAPIKLMLRTVSIAGVATVVKKAEYFERDGAPQYQIYYVDPKTGEELSNVVLTEKEFLALPLVLFECCALKVLTVEEASR